MRKLLLFIAIGFSIQNFAQSISDSTNILIGANADKLVYNKYDDSNCLLYGDYAKSVEGNDLLYASAIFKCKSNIEKKNILQVYVNGSPFYYELLADAKMVLNGKINTAENFFLFYNNLSQTDKDNLDVLAKNKSIEFRDYTKRKLGDYLLSFKKYGIGIIEAVPTENYSMTGADFKVFNASEKTIKYITFNFYGKNAVKDKVGQLISRKGIGPIEQYETGTWSFDTVWLTDIVQTLKLVSVNIIYMNGTSKTIPITSSYFVDSDKLTRYNSLLEN